MPVFVGTPDTDVRKHPSSYADYVPISKKIAMSGWSGSPAEMRGAPSGTAEKPAGPG